MTISAQTFDEHKRFLWGLCYRMTGSAADADDIVQDTFVKVLEKPPADMESSIRPWLVKVAMNLSRDQLRRRRRREYVGPWLPSPVLRNPSLGDKGDMPCRARNLGARSPASYRSSSAIFRSCSRWDPAITLSFSSAVTTETPPVE